MEIGTAYGYLLDTIKIILVVSENSVEQLQGWVSLISLLHRDILCTRNGMVYPNMFKKH